MKTKFFLYSILISFLITFSDVQSAEVSFSFDIQEGLTNSNDIFEKKLKIFRIIDIVGDIDKETNNDLIQAYKNMNIRFNSIYERYSNRKPLITTLIYLNSNGGSINEAFKLSKTIKDFESYISIIVAVKEKCISACTIILFSSNFRAARYCDIVAVHRASLNGIENNISYDSSLQIAKYLRTLNIPYDVVEKMMSTRASQISILTLEEMKRSGITILDSRNICGKIEQ